MLTFFIPIFVWMTDAAVLADALDKAYPGYFKQDSAFEHVLAAKAAETPDVPAIVLLSMARVESGYKRKTVSAPIRDCSKLKETTGKDCYFGRRIGVWDSDKPGSNWIPAGTVYIMDNGKKKVSTYFCGVTQATAKSWKQCLHLRNLMLAYKSTALQLSRWINHPLCVKARAMRFKCMLRGYGGGKPMILKKGNRYPRKVERRMNEIKRQLPKPIT